MYIIIFVKVEFFFYHMTRNMILRHKYLGANHFAE